MNEFLHMGDRLIIPEEDDLIIVNDIHRSKALTPQGRLFEILDVKNNHRVVREIACNTVVIGGAIRALANLLDVTPNWEPSVVAGSTTSDKVKLALFGVGSGGANNTFGSVVAPRIWQKDVDGRIPLRRLNGTPTGEDAGKYFGAKAESGMNNWYYKEFASTPIIKTCVKNSATPDQDGTEITGDITDGSQVSAGVETFAEISIHFNTSDVREYYENIGSPTLMYNTIGFFTGSKTGTTYNNIRLYSVVNFNNFDVSTAVSRDLLYRVYSLI